MPLEIKPRKDRAGSLTITGTVAGQRIRRRAASADPRLAREEAATLEAQILRSAWHGERRGARGFAAAVASYLDQGNRAEGDRRRLARLMRAIGDVTLAEITQETVDKARKLMLAPDASPATVRRGIITPLRAVLRHAHKRGWCDVPAFDIPREASGRTLYLLPHEAERLIDSAADHLRPLLTFLLCTGARMAEALDLDWRDVDLAGAHVIFWRTKSGKRRVAALPRRAVAALSALTHRDGAVFRWDRRRSPKRQGEEREPAAYADRARKGGGQIKTAWRGCRRRAGLNPTLTPHDLRHTWASWRYALDRDLLALKTEGGWSSVDQVERYAHLLPAGNEAAIRAFWHLGDTTAQRDKATA